MKASHMPYNIHRDTYRTTCNSSSTCVSQERLDDARKDYLGMKRGTDAEDRMRKAKALDDARAQVCAVV